MAHDCVRCDAPFRTRLDNNGQTSILVRDGYDVNDPKRPLAEPRRLDDFLPRETSAAKRGIAHQGNEADVAFIKGVMASRGARFLCLLTEFPIHREPLFENISPFTGQIVDRFDVKAHCLQEFCVSIQVA